MEGPFGVFLWALAIAASIVLVSVALFAASAIVVTVINKVREGRERNHQ